MSDENEPVNEPNKDEKPFEISVSFCWMGIHKWTPWTDTRQGNIVSDKTVVGYYVQQERRCLRCNKLQLRVVSTI